MLDRSPSIYNRAYTVFTFSVGATQARCCLSVKKGNTTHDNYQLPHSICENGIALIEPPSPSSFLANHLSVKPASRKGETVPEKRVPAMVPLDSSPPLIFCGRLKVQRHILSWWYANAEIKVCLFVAFGVLFSPQCQLKRRKLRKDNLPPVDLRMTRRTESDHQMQRRLAWLTMMHSGIGITTHLAGVSIAL